ncbi:MAG TPA: FAD-dependent oxidoreductase [Streptosporangiaceae bacterium]|nr:FAD-dependent oxidoreductase [Streptosporangiaceae bacterium]
MTRVNDTADQPGGAFGFSTAEPGRRSFLVSGAVLGAGVLASQGGLGSGAIAASPSAGPTDSDWTALRHSLSTKALSRPGNKSYPLAHQLFDPRFDNLHPSGIAFCGKPADVSECLAFVRKFKVRFRVRSGGHSYAGWSSLDGGLVIDISRMSHFSLGNGTVTVGAGIDLIHLYEQLAAHGLAIPGGSCPTVGLAGLALGGGIGVLARQYGRRAAQGAIVRQVGLLQRAALGRWHPRPARFHRTGGRCSQWPGWRWRRDRVRRAGRRGQPSEAASHSIRAP